MRLHEPGDQRRVRCVVGSQLGLLQPDHDRQSGGPRGLGHAQSRLADRRRRAAGDRAAGRGGGQLQPPGLEQLLPHPQPRAHGRGLRRGHAHRTLESDMLPNGGGYPVTFLTRNTRSALGATDSYYTTTDDFGGETHYWHGVDVSFNARMRNGLSLQGGTSTGRGVGDTCDMLTARFGRPMAPTLGTAAVPVIAVGIVDGVRACDVRGALADQRSRARLLHRAQGGRPRQRHLPLAGQCAARRRPGHERRVADGDLSHERRAVPGRNRTTAGHRVGHAGREPRAAG